MANYYNPQGRDAHGATQQQYAPQHPHSCKLTKSALLHLIPCILPLHSMGIVVWAFYLPRNADVAIISKPAVGKSHLELHHTTFSLPMLGLTTLNCSPAPRPKPKFYYHLDSSPWAPREPAHLFVLVPPLFWSGEAGRRLNSLWGCPILTR